MTIRFDASGPVILPFGQARRLRLRRKAFLRAALFAAALAFFIVRLGAIA